MISRRKAQSQFNQLDKEIRELRRLANKNKGYYPAPAPSQECHELHSLYHQILEHYKAIDEHKQAIRELSDQIGE